MMSRKDAPAGKRKTEPRRASPSSATDRTARLHLVLYSLLLVATPFVLLRAFMQDAIGRASRAAAQVGGLSIPVVPLVATAVLATLLILLRNRLRWRHARAGLAGLGMIAAAQNIADYYYGHAFYELQHNWHYFAYSIFAFLAYRDLRPRGVSLARYSLTTFFLAACYSTFDEGFQLFMSQRVFDVGDIAKDVWGALTGITVILLGGEHPELARGAWRTIRHRRLRSYLRHAPSLWVLQIGAAIILLGCSSLLTDVRYAGTVPLLTAGGFLLFFLILHVSQFRLAGRLLLALLICGVLGQAYAYARYRHAGVVYHAPRLTIYRGLVLPYFDVMIKPDGSFRLVDKKLFFNYRDQTYFQRQDPDILLIGSGYDGKGGKGFPHAGGSRFIYNPFSRRGMQVIILDASEAVQRFNRLQKEGKRVLFVHHAGD